MTLIDYLIKNGWVSGCQVASYREPDTIRFLPPTAFHVMYNEKMMERLTASGLSTACGTDLVKHSDYLAECERLGVPPRYIPGEVLTEAVKKTPVHPHLPPISRIYWGPSVELLPSIPVIAVTANRLGVPQYLTGYYSHAQARWIIGLDWVGNHDVIEWWPLPEAGTGTKPPQKQIA